MKYIIFALLLLPLFVNAETLSAPIPSSVVALDKIAVVVNDEVITQSEVAARLQQILEQYHQAQQPAPATADIYPNLLQQIILERLQLQLAKKNGLSIDDELVDKAINQIAANNHLSTADMRATLEQSGTTWTTYRRQIHDELLIEQLQHKSLDNKINVTDEEIKHFVANGNTPSENSLYHVQDILIDLPAAPTPEQVDQAKARAKQIIQALNTQDAAQVIADLKKADTPIETGDLGLRHLAALPDLFAQAVANQPQGSIIGPLHAPNGFHILRIAEIKTSDKPLTEADIKNLIYARKFNEERDLWLKQLRAEAYVKIVGDNK